MLQGHNHRQIAQAIGLTTHTIQYHMVEIWDRLCEQRNQWYARSVLSALCDLYNMPGQSVPFRKLKIGQRFQYQGQLHEKVNRARDKCGPYNAISLAGDRKLFEHRIIVEVVT